MLFYLGTHMLNHAKEFDRVFISVRVLRRKNRQSDINANCWIMDSGAFTELAQHGTFQTSVEQYASEINRWSKFANFELAVTQDYMCEPFMLAKTGMTVEDHQRLTIERYDTLIRLTDALIMPVLQGYVPSEYATHILMYGDRLITSMRVGVGSICKRNKDPRKVIAVLKAIKSLRPDLQLHGFGLKITALEDTYISSMLHSADSMAWSMAARRQGRNANGLIEAIKFNEHIEQVKGKKERQLEILP